jgi:hypothetical protein
MAVGIVKIHENPSAILPHDFCNHIRDLASLTSSTSVDLSLAALTDQSGVGYNVLIVWILAI